MKRSSLPAAALPAAVLILGARSGGEAAPTTTGTAATTGPAQFEVVMESFALTPAELTVPVGATVTWVNHHTANHDVVADDGTFASPLFGQGETYSFTFTEPGEYPYICTIHPSLQGTIIVTAPQDARPFRRRRCQAPPMPLPTVNARARRGPTS